MQKNLLPRKMSLYSVFHRLRSKKIEELVGPKESCFDKNEIVFQSLSEEKALQFFESIEKVDGNHWRTVSKYLVITPLDKKCSDGFINEKHIKSEHYN